MSTFREVKPQELTAEDIGTNVEFTAVGRYVLTPADILPEGEENTGEFIGAIQTIFKLGDHVAIGLIDGSRHRVAPGTVIRVEQW